MVCPTGENSNLRQSPCYPEGFLISWASSIKDGVQEPMQSPVTKTCDFWGKGKKKETSETYECRARGKNSKVWALFAEWETSEPLGMKGSHILQT